MTEHCETCRNCKHPGPHTVEVQTSGVHYAKIECINCRRFIRWLSKPESDPTKYKRPNAHKDLVSKFSNGFCEMCLRDQNNLPKGQTLEAQHVIEFQDGGSEKRENIWIVCTACHRWIHWIRTYHGRDNIAIRNQVTGQTLWNE